MAEQTVADKLLNELIKKIKKYHPSENVELIERAYRISEEAHRGQIRKSGEPYIVHPMITAMILAELKADKETIAAGILHDIIEDTDVDQEKIREEFGEEILFLVQGVTKIERLSTQLPEEERQIDNIKKLLLATADDVRVVLVKLADRLHNMRTLQYQSAAKQIKIAQETIDIYAPIAERLGISVIEAELKDLSLQYLQPEIYQRLKTKLTRLKIKNRKVDEEILAQISAKLMRAHIKNRVSGSYGQLFRACQKFLKDEQEAELAIGAFTVEVVLESPGKCYEALGLLHELYPPIPGTFKDYIATPRENLYRALHTKVIAFQAKIVAIHLMTREMKLNNRQGILYYWKYKGGTVAEREMAKAKEKLSWLREILEWQIDGDNTKFMQLLKNDFHNSNEKIYCFTPLGKTIELPKGSVAVDFAYAVHSEIGNHIKGVKINHMEAKPETELVRGDVVEIITSAEITGPQFDWIRKVKTSKAKNRILQQYKVSHDEEPMQLGETMFLRMCSAYCFSAEEREKIKEQLCKYYKISDWRLLASGMGRGEIDAENVLKKIDIMNVISSTGMYDVYLLADDRMGLISQVANCFCKYGFCIEFLNVRVNAKKHATIEAKIKLQQASDVDVKKLYQEIQDIGIKNLEISSCRK